MFERPAESPAYQRLGGPEPASAVVLAVPHAGRFYPNALLAESRLPERALELLADRDADRLIGHAVAAGAVAVVGTHARAWIDLNRDPREMEPSALTPRPPRELCLTTGKTRGGLGVVPTRIAGHGEIRRAPLSMAELHRRIAGAHEPYHRAVAAALAAARAAHGIAILLDIHSMPTLEGKNPARVVIGDRGGRSAARAFTEATLAAARARWQTALNEPYAGGYTLDRHGRPQRGVHAIQIEFDRSLYLGPDGRADHPATEDLSAWLGALVGRLSPPEAAIAAE